MGGISRLAIFVAVVLLTIVSMWTTYASLKDSIMPEPMVTIPLGRGYTWDCSIFALGLSVAIGLMLFALKLAIIDGQKRLNIFGLIGMTVVASISITFNMDVLYRVGDREFFLRHSTAKVKSTYDTYLAEVRTQLLSQKQGSEKALARQEGELEAEIRGLREDPAGYGRRAKQEDHRLTVLEKETAVEVSSIEEALIAQEQADALLASSQPKNIDEVLQLQDQLRVAVKNAGALAGVAMPESVSVENPLFAVFEKLFDFETVGWKELFFLALAFLIDLGDIIGYCMVPAAAAVKPTYEAFNPNTLPTRRRRVTGPERIPEEYLPFSEPSPMAAVTGPLDEPAPERQSGPEHIPPVPHQGTTMTFRRRGSSRFRM
jgi:hypothetical protein